MADFIKNFWDNNAVKFGQSHWVSWGDNFAIELEIDQVAKLVKDDQRVLDVGCANGFSTLAQKRLNHSIDITGVDYAPAMIEQATKNLESTSLKGVSFAVGDATKLEFEDNTFDLVYTSRVLINIPNWEQQKIAIKECLRVTKKGGTVVLSEAFWEPLVKLNALRTIMGLPSLIEHDFNRYLKKSKLKEFLDDEGLSYENVDFSSVYYFGSRLLREILTDSHSYEGYSNPINKEFYHLEKKYSGGDVGIQQAFIIKKGDSI